MIVAAMRVASWRYRPLGPCQYCKIEIWQTPMRNLKLWTWPMKTLQSCTRKIIQVALDSIKYSPQLTSIIRESTALYGCQRLRSSRHCQLMVSAWDWGPARSKRLSTEKIPSLGNRGISSAMRQVISYSSWGLRAIRSTWKHMNL